MPVPLNPGTPDPRDFIDDPGDTSYKWGGPGTGGRGSSQGPAALGFGGYGGSMTPYGGASAFGFNDPLRRRMMLGGRMGPTPGAGGMTYGTGTVDPSQFSGSTMMGAQGPVGGQMPWQGGAQALGARWGRPGEMRPPGYTPPPQGRPGPGGQVAAPPGGGQGYLEDAINRLRTPGAATEHDFQNILTWLAMGGQSPLLAGSILDPKGTAASQEARRGEADRTRRALESRNKLKQSQYGRLDAGQRAHGDYFSGLSTNQGIAEANSLIEAQGARDLENFLRQYLSGKAGSSFQRDQNEQQSLLAQRYMQDQPSGIPGMVGQIVGSALPGFLQRGGGTTMMPVPEMGRGNPDFWTGRLG